MEMPAMNMPKKPEQSLASVVGTETYAVWVNMLNGLVPQGRTHRLAPLVAGMLHYALAIAEKNHDAESDTASAVQSLLYAAETSDPSEVEKYLKNMVKQLFKDAKVKYNRTNAYSEKYSILESTYEEFVNWYNMSWE
jgi:hypothetical protein